MRLNTLHNLTYYLRLMAQVREAISEGRYAAFHREFVARTREREAKPHSRGPGARRGARSLLAGVGFSPPQGTKAQVCVSARLATGWQV